MRAGKLNWSNGLLKHEYNFVAHHIFLHYRDELLSNKPELKNSYDKRIENIKINPFIGSPMKYVPEPLQGKIFKVKIGGRKGHSLCYIIFEERKIALGVYITPKSRDKVDYKNFPWDHFLEAAEDYKKGNLKNFKIL